MLKKKIRANKTNSVRPDALVEILTRHGCILIADSLRWLGLGGRRWLNGVIRRVVEH